MQFCDECGSMMHADGDVWVCRSCGHETARDEAAAAMTTTEGQSDDEGVVDMSEVEDTEIGPTTDARCSNSDCDGERARYEMKQIRAADESETRFFTCVECGKKWREDDN